MSTTWFFAWKRLRSIWTIVDLRKKILFTVGLLLVYRVLAHITVPLTHQEQVNLANLFGNTGGKSPGQLLGLLDVFSGGSLQTFSIVALGLAPYITATIVMQLLQPIIPALHNLATQGEVGRLRISQLTRLITVPLAFLQALGQSAIFVREGVLDANSSKKSSVLLTACFFEFSYACLRNNRLGGRLHYGQPITWPGKHVSDR